MKIHEVELKNVRHLRHVKLDLTSPITIIGGRMGIGKTTLQQALLTSMFHAKKEDRESLVSEYDRDSKPQAVLRLSRGGPRPTITLSRTLTDEQGTWEENGKALRGKGKALEEIQKTLPISCDAAALLLWGLQEQMSQVLTEFPQDGKKLLTAATVCGAGPDPAEVMQDLKKQFGEAKVDGARNQGSLTQARKAVGRLEEEMRVAGAAQERMQELEEEFGQAKRERDQLAEQRQRLDNRVMDAERLLGLLEAADKAQDVQRKLDERAEKFRTLDELIHQAERTRDALADDLRVLETQLRVARDEQIGAELARLSAQIAAGERFAHRVEEITVRLRATARPGREDMKKLAELQKQIDDATGRMEASGFHYRVIVTSVSQRVEIVEDLQPARTVEVGAGGAVEGIAGRVQLRSGGLDIAVSGKEDVAAHKRRIERARTEIKALLARFAVGDEAALAALANEQVQLNEELAKARQEVDRHLGGASLDDLRSRRTEGEQARTRSNMTEADVANCAGRHLPSAEELKDKMIAKDAEWAGSKRQVDQLTKQRPSEDESKRLAADLNAARAAAENARAAFQQSDPRHREPRLEVRDEIRSQLRADQDELRNVSRGHGEADRKYVELATRLQHEGPERPLSSMEAELDDAQMTLHREEVLQDARQLLIDRIENKTTELAAAVPEELALRVSAHLAELSSGAYARVNLSPQLQVDSICRSGEASEQWRPEQLSVGERTMAALTLKIAVARALAEMHHPVFIVLDDSFVNLDPEHRAATERLLLDLVADGNLQVILLTCHSDWARDWHAQAPDQINHINLEEVADYYRAPAAMAVD